MQFNIDSTKSILPWALARPMGLALSPCNEAVLHLASACLLVPSLPFLSFPHAQPPLPNWEVIGQRPSHFYVFAHALLRSKYPYNFIFLVIF